MAGDLGHVPCGYNQLTTFNAAAVGLGQGLNNVKAGTVVARGSGYVLGDYLLVVGGTFQLFAARFRVTSVDVGGWITGTPGAVMAVALTCPGIYTSNPSTPNTPTTGSVAGTGCTLALTFNTNVVPWAARWCDFLVETATVRFRDDGIAPTATVGTLLTVNANGGRPVSYNGPPGLVQVIATGSTSVLNVNFYGVSPKEFFCATDLSQGGGL